MSVQTFNWELLISDMISGGINFSLEGVLQPPQQQ
jgi:hypothetical protein